MRTPSKEFMKCLENSAAYQYILHTKKTDFSELDKICEDFEKDILEAQEVDRKKNSGGTSQMIVEFSVFDTPTFSVEHLFDTPNNQALINDFKVSNDALISLLTTRTTK